MISLYTYWRSSAAYRCRIALNLKGVDHAAIFVHLRHGEQRLPDYGALNPQGLVPVLETDGQVLTQSLAIIEWLDETYPEPPLLPETPLARAHVRALSQLIACDVHPLQNLRVLQYLKSELGADQASRDAWCHKWIGDGLAASEALLACQGNAHSYCFGETPMLADVCLAPQLYSAQRFGIALERMPRLRALAEAYAAHPAFIAAHPDNQPDFER